MPCQCKGQGHLSLPVQVPRYASHPGGWRVLVWGQVGLFGSGKLSDALFMPLGCGVCDSAFWRFWSRMEGIYQSPCIRTVGQSPATGTATGLPFPSCPSSFTPASSSSVRSPLSSIFLLSPLFCPLLPPPPLPSPLLASKGTSALHQETDFFRPSGPAGCLLLISTVHPIQHSVVMEMF